MQEEGIFRMDEILEHLSFEEKKFLDCSIKKIESILKEEEYTEEKLFFNQKMERYIRENWI